MDGGDGVELRDIEVIGLEIVPWDGSNDEADTIIELDDDIGEETCEIVIHTEGVIERKATDENEVEIVDEMIATEENEDEAKNVLEVLGIFESVLIQSENAKNDIMNSKSEYYR